MTMRPGDTFDHEQVFGTQLRRPEPGYENAAIPQTNRATVQGNAVPANSKPGVNEQPQR